MLRDREYWLSGYEILWVLVMFDLPVVEKTDRKAATKFRQFLLDQGFAMAQYSVYYRMVSGKESGTTLEGKVQANLPEFGSVQILSITDRQYENIRIFKGRRRENVKKTNNLFYFRSVFLKLNYKRRQPVFVFKWLTPIECSYSEIPVNPQQRQTENTRISKCSYSEIPVNPQRVSAAR
jgi:CRISPR-associated protein Cas2